MASKNQLLEATLSKYEFRKSAWRERWHELSYENKTWFDMVRIRKGFNPSRGFNSPRLASQFFKSIFQFIPRGLAPRFLIVETREFEDYVGYQFINGPVLSERELLFPIPTDEIRNNEKLTQNPGY